MLRCFWLDTGWPFLGEKALVLVSSLYTLQVVCSRPSWLISRSGARQPAVLKAEAESSGFPDWHSPHKAPLPRGGRNDRN